VAVLALGFAFLLFGAVSIWDGLRIGKALRARGTLDLIGPDRYLIGVAVLLLLVGALLVVSGLRSRRSPRPAGSPAPIVAGDEPKGNAHLWLLAALILYVSLLPVLGYLVATVLFTAAVSRIMGTVRWTSIVAGAVVLTAVCYASFLWIADLPLPRGMLGIG
jgi:putative tricarboxylic transport membrane protein